MPDDFDATVTGLRKWSANHDPHVQAAVELLCWHEHWLRRGSFRLAAVRPGIDGENWVNWLAAREFFASGPRGSTSELAILDLAIALGEDRYRLSRMGSAHSPAIADAVSRAVGIEPGAAPPAPKLTVAESFDVTEARRVLGGSNPGLLSASLNRLLDIIGRIAPEGGPRG